MSRVLEFLSFYNTIRCIGITCYASLGVTNSEFFQFPWPPNVTYEWCMNHARQRQQRGPQGRLSETTEGQRPPPDQDASMPSNYKNTAQHVAQVKTHSHSELCASIAGWQTEWGPAATWGKNFHCSLTHAQEKGRRTTDEFFAHCEDHVCKGRVILCDLQLLAHHPNKGPMQMKDMYIQMYDLMSLVLTEVIFFEVKLEEYAPAVPLSKVSEVQYYHTI
ncbi:hypothetical protein DFH29DRAFT_881109 [Suillus ampliporus]|nr:hypothetical protein DFH29DRAFT_881109 [Suillus ampliporus]